MNRRGDDALLQREGRRGGKLRFLVLATAFHDADGVLVALTRTTVVETGQAPPNLLQDEDYLDTQLAGYRASEAKAEASAVASDDASRQADQYVLLTLVFASALFFAGVTSSFRMRFARILMLVGATMLIAYAAARLADYPVA